MKLKSNINRSGLKARLLKIALHSRKITTEFYNLWRHYSLLYAIYELIWWICFYLRPPCCYKISTYAIIKKTEWLDRYIEKKYKVVIDHYKKNPPISSPAINIQVWIFWGQGEDQMPPLVRSCYKQLCHFNKNVQLITLQNVKDYISLSPSIYKKVESGCISWANYSDIVRNKLLAEYGGLWLDATVWCSGLLPLQKLMTHPIYSANGSVPITNKSIRFWTSFEWNWSSWCMWSRDKKNLLFSFVSEMLTQIAERENYWPDYVIQDYLIYYACRTFPSVRKNIETQSIHNPYRNVLATILNNPFDEIIYKKLIDKEFIFKLSFRANWIKQTPQGDQTFYGRILEGIINPNLNNAKQ